MIIMRLRMRIMKMMMIMCILLVYRILMVSSFKAFLCFSVNH